MLLLNINQLQEIPDKKKNIYIKLQKWLHWSSNLSVLQIQVDKIQI